MADDEIIVPAAFDHALNALDKHLVASRELTAAITAINEHSVDIDDDAMAAIESEQRLHRAKADAIAEALNLKCGGYTGTNSHVLNVNELYIRKCNHCGKVVVVGAKQ